MTFIYSDSESEDQESEVTLDLYTYYQNSSAAQHTSVTLVFDAETL